jgi:GT2 family glycosyltransferase
MDLSIIIVNWKSADYLRACIESIYRETTGIDFEAIVVDNASGDDSERMVGEEFPQAQFIQCGENLGFARANNLGFGHATGDCVLFLNPDTELRRNVLAQMVKHLRADLIVGAVGARLLNTDGSLQASCVQALPTISNQVFDSELLRRCFPNWRGWGTQALFQKKLSPADVDAISGACFMVKRTVFERAGMFSEEYFMYSDDLDLSFKIRKQGYIIQYLNDCEVIHHGGKSSSKREDYFADLLQRESLAKFFEATRGRFYCYAYRGALALVSMVRLLLVVLLFLVGKHHIQHMSSRLIIGKWWKILRWSIGVGHHSPTLARSQSTL